jgi:hypothetical protein
MFVRAVDQRWVVTLDDRLANAMRQVGFTLVGLAVD